MKIETFKKRFDYPSDLLDGLIWAKLQGRNGKEYNISTNKKGDPIAKEIKPKD